MLKYYVINTTPNIKCIKIKWTKKNLMQIYGQKCRFFFQNGNVVNFAWHVTVDWFCGKYSHNFYLSDTQLHDFNWNNQNKKKRIPPYSQNKW